MPLSFSFSRKFTATVICSDDTKIKVANSEGKQVIVPHSKLLDVIEQVLKDKFGKVPKHANWAYNKADGSTRTLMVHDLSPAGIGVAFDPKIDKFEEGQVLRGSLHLMGHDSFTVRFEVVTVHALEEDPSHRLMGCRFVGLGFAGCEKIAVAMDGEATETSD